MARKPAPVIKFLLFVLGAYALLCALAFLFQRKLIYFPGPPPSTLSSDLPFEEVSLRTEDGESLHAWWFANSDAHGAVIVSHGNAGNIASRMELARAFSAMGYGVLLYDYRGYGSSTGQPSEQGLYRDAEAAWAYLVEQVGVSPSAIVCYGESLGGAVAVELALRQKVSALIVEASFTSLPDVASEVYPWLPTRLLLRDRFASIDKIGSLEVPILILHSPDDDLIPLSHGERLFEAANEPKEWVRTRGGHNDGGFRLGFRPEVASFLESVRNGSPR